MLRHLILKVAIVALALAWPAAASAQSLAELAKKNKKKDDKESSETITSRDLRRAGRTGRGNVSPDRSTTAAAGRDAESGDAAEGNEGSGSEGGEEEKSPQELREEAQADWSQRLTAAEAEVTRLEGRISEIQQSLANPGVGSVEQRAERNANLEKAQADLAAARQNIANLQREGRQNGYRR